MYRLGDLNRRSTRIVAAIALLLALPFVAAIARASSVGWQPSGDNGAIGLQALDVFGGDPPLIGLPSTAGNYVEANPNHPGPIEFYALAVPMELFGHRLGMVAWTGFVNGASVLVAAWVIFRRGGPVAGLWGAGVLGLIAWSEGAVQLTDAVSSNAGGIPMVALAALAVALADGDRRLLPLFAVWSAYVTQQHLGVVAFGAALTLGGLVGLVAPDVWAWARPRVARWRGAPRASAGNGARAAALGGRVHAAPRRRARAVDVRAAGPGPDRRHWPTGDDRWWPWVGAAFVTMVLWFPVLIDLATGNPSNIEKMLHFSGSEGRQTVGPAAGLRQVVRALGIPPLVTRTNLDGLDLVAPASVFAWLGAVAVVAFLGWTAYRRWRSHPLVARTAVVALSLAAIGGVIGSNVPEFESERLNLYRWTFVVSVLTWLVLAWEAGDWLAARRRPTPYRPVWYTPWAAVAGIGVIALLASTIGGPTTYRDGELFDTEAEINARVRVAVEGQETVLIAAYGVMGPRSLAAALAVDLEANGHKVVVPYDELPNYGPHRSLEENPNPDTAIVIRTGHGRLGRAEPSATVLFTEDFNEGRDTVARLVAQIGENPIVLSPNANDLAVAAGSDPGPMQLAIERLTSDPTAVFYNDALVRILAQGYLTSPAFDPALLQDLIDNPLNISWGEDRIEVAEVPIEEMLRLHPNIGAPSASDPE